MSRTNSQKKTGCPEIRHLLLILLTCLTPTVLLARTNVSVDISGVDTPLENNIRLLLSIEQQKNDPLMSETRLRRLHRKAPQEIGKALQPFGYYRPEITSRLTQIAADQWQASYTVDPGPPVLIDEMDFVLAGEMLEDPDFIAAAKIFPLQSGDIFNHRQYESGKSDLAKLAAERGYFDAGFSMHRVEIDLEHFQARIHLHFDSGIRYHFGDVQLLQHALDPQLLRRYIPFQKGAPYTLNELIDLQQALNDSDYFQSVEISTAEPQDTEIPVTVKLIPRKRNRYTFGAGYGTDTGGRIKLGWETPRVNRHGHRLNTEAKISEIGYSVGAQYHVPVLNPRTDQIIYSVAVVNEKTDTSDSTLRTAGASLNRSREKWRESVSLNYQQEEYVVADVRDVSYLLIPGASWSRTWGRNLINVLDGLRFDIGLRGASSSLFSDTDFFQLQAGIKAINPLGQHNRLITRGRLGTTWMDEFRTLPSSVRFFTGGAQSVRGYAYQSLGPVDSKGRVIGGKHLLTGSVELEHSFSGKWGVAMFFDTGNAIDNFTDSLERGAGFGLRWQSPVGPVRLDIASAVSRDGQPWRLHINIGPDL